MRVPLTLRTRVANPGIDTASLSVYPNHYDSYHSI